MTFRSNPHPDYFCYGFRRAEIQQFLTAKGIAVDLYPKGGATESEPPQATIPDWAEGCKALKEFSHTQAADVLIGYDPFVVESNYANFDPDPDLLRMLATLEQAAEHGELQVLRQSQDEHGIKRYTFRHDDLRQWAKAHGYSWCIPQSPAYQAINTPSTDTELLGKYQDAEREKARLQQENDQLKEQLKRHAEQKNALLEKTEQIGKLQAENDRLNAELGSGKGKNTLLKMIAGMAISGHGINIHSERIEGISELADDLAEAGAPLDPKTISDRLKEAAQLIPRPKK